MAPPNPKGCRIGSLPLVHSVSGNLLEDLQGAIGEAQNKLKIINGATPSGNSEDSTTPAGEKLVLQS